MQLRMQLRKVGLDILGNERSRLGKQQRLELGVVQRLRQRPVEPRLAGTLQVFGDRPLGHTGGGGDPLVTEISLELEAENFLDLAHGLPVGRHSTSPRNRGG